jgi:hypothetical protein
VLPETIPPPTPPHRPIVTYIVTPPNATPTPPTPPSPAPDVVVHGKTLIVPKNYAFPPVCLVTGRTDDLVEVRRKLSWHASGVYLLILINLLIYIIVAMVVRKTSEHTFYLSRQERDSRRKWTVVGWITVLAGIGSLVVGAAMETPAMIIACPILLIAGIVVFYTKVQLLRAERISETSASIRGIAPAVMNQLAARGAAA